VTVRQGLHGLTSPPPTDEGGNSHWHIPGARLYRGHGGSDLDWPSKTIKAGVHGVGGGENIIHLDDGTFRYYSLREMARLQDFPDDYVFQGPRSRIIGQIGNAVPCGLAKALVSGLAAPLEAFDRSAAPSRSTEHSAGSGATSRGN
jgi:DNA (cytosine-5)-methyltransferase 1